MSEIRPIGQVITSLDYATDRLFNLNPEPLKEAAENFLACGVTEIEIPDGLLDPEGRSAETGIDEDTVRRTIDLLPEETRVVATYVGPGELGKNKQAFLDSTKRKIDHLAAFFPDLDRAMMHPPGIKGMTKDDIATVVDAWAEVAKYAADKIPGFQCSLHNHFDTSCETAEQVRTYLDALEAADEPALRWGPDTGHCHGMRDEYLPILGQYAHLIGNHFHIKARVPAFDQLHGGDAYRPDRDIWTNKAEFGSGLYSGFVNCADPEMETPFGEVFGIIKEKARPTDGVITAAIEIDIPRQHPRLEIMCSILYLKQVHGLEPAMSLSCDQIVERVFAQRP